MSKQAELTENQKRFVQEYVIDRNATRAYIASFGSSKHMPSYASARVEASRLLTNPNIASEVKVAAKAHATSCGIRARKVLQELACVAFFDPVDVFTEDETTGLPIPRHWDTIPPAARRAIKAVEVRRRRIITTAEVIEEVEQVEYVFCNKVDALTKLCDYLGLMKENNALHQLLNLIESHYAKST